jgi:glycosyltransferase involved in cell wall biosynthesis
MLTGHNLIYFGPGPWQGLWRNRHQLMTRFAHCNRVLYVEPPLHLRPAVRQFLTEQASWRALRCPRIYQAWSGLYIYRSPAFAPISGRFPLSSLTRTLRRTSLLRALRQLEIQRPIIWLSRPEMADLIGQFHEQLVIYHVVDEYAAYRGVTQEQGEQLRLQEKKLMGQADLVVVVSPALLEAKQPYNPHTYLVLNGVDAEVFAQAALGKNSPPADLAAIREPRLVYAGLIGTRLDLSLLATLATRHPDWALVLIGEVDSRDCESELAQLQLLSNVHFLGLKPASAVPDYLVASQVCLLPYRLSLETYHIDPLKLYDGLASGKPIVSTAIPAATPYRDLIRLVSSAGEFEAAIQAALAERDAALAVRRRAVAAANSWTARAEQISNLIETHLHPNPR